LETPPVFRHGSGTFRHTKKEPVTGLVSKAGVFLKKAAEFSKLFRQIVPAWFRHIRKSPDLLRQRIDDRPAFLNQQKSNLFP